MGWGNEIMVSGEAVRLGCKPEMPLIVLGKNGRPRWNELWRGNPRIWQPGTVRPRRSETLRSHGNWRSHLVADDDETRWVFNPTWRATVGELPVVERKASGRYIVIEPNLKAGHRINRDWGWARWQGLIDTMPGIDFVQLGPRGTATLDGARLIETTSFIVACSWLSGAWAAVLPEGGLHHAAAALGIPGVVLFGGSRRVKSTGYPGHINLDDPDPETQACGSRQPCDHCEDFWNRLTPDIVAEAVGAVMCA